MDPKGSVLKIGAARTEGTMIGVGGVELRVFTPNSAAVSFQIPCTSAVNPFGVTHRSVSIIFVP